MRISEILSLTSGNVTFKPDHIVLRIAQSKTDQTRQGNEVVLAKTGSLICPCTALLNYINRANISLTSNEKLFRNIYLTKGTERLLETPLTYSRTRFLFRETFLRAGLNPSNFGTHSLRSGGATTAANKGVTFEEIKRHGRWRSNKTVDRYVSYSLSKRLSVSKSLF